jgi:hypothetical protein
LRLSNEAYLHRNCKQVPGDVLKKTAEALTIDQKEAYKVHFKVLYFRLHFVNVIAWFSYFSGKIPS